MSSCEVEVMMVLQEQQQQRREALQRANQVRSQRAEIKRQLVDGELTFAELLASPPLAIHTATIGTVLEWVPGIGHWRGGRVLGGGPRPPGGGAGGFFARPTPGGKK